MEKKKRIITGCSDFKEMIETNAYYVDKSLFIKEIIENGDKVILLPRPRRFGKTLNLSMLGYFFDIQHPENKELFTDLQIWQSDEEIKAEQGKYPVIYLSLRNAKGDNWEDCFDDIKHEIANLFKQHRYLLDSATIYKEELTVFSRILDKTADKSDYKNSLKFLCDLLHRFYNKRVVILLDEYDAPIQSAYGKYYDKSISFVRALMSGAFKDNINLHKGVITGILRVAKESIFSGLNNIGVYSILKNKFSTSFGFTEEELKQLLSYFQINAPFDDIKAWYNGYKFGKTESIYNPWSILKLALNWEDEEKFNTYWANTSSNDLIKSEIRNKQNASIREDILKLIDGQVIEKEIEENFVFTDLESDKYLVWTLFLFGGYLTVNEQVSSYTYKLRIPNYEVQTIFKRSIKNWFQIDMKLQRERLEILTKALLSNDLTTFEKEFKTVTSGVFSYHDIASKNEYVYHSYLLGLFAILHDDYISKSNRESGEGRYDIMLIPRNKDRHKTGVVIEVKRIEKQLKGEENQDFHNRINQELSKAKNQINKNKYSQDLIDFGIHEENIVKVAIVFAGKEPYVNELTINNE